MYLTQIIIKMDNRYAIQLISDCQKMHCFVMKGFPDIQSNQARDQLGILYKTESEGEYATLYVQSNIKPDLSKFAEYSVSVKTKNIDELKNALVNNKILRFSLYANPTIQRKLNTEDTNSKRVFISNDKERAEWLKRKMNLGGAELLSIQESASSTVNGNHKNNMIHAVGIQWTGTLRIVDEELFWGLLSKGIGAEKAYGFGMLQLSRY